jgi:hypothetical protein
MSGAFGYETRQDWKLAGLVAHTDDTNFRKAGRYVVGNGQGRVKRTGGQDDDLVSQPRTVGADADGSACGSGALLQSHHAATCSMLTRL